MNKELDILWCKNCKVEINEEICPVCGTKADLDIPVEIYWCDHCKIPLIRSVNDVTKDQCPLCGGETKYLVADLRPVFPEERLLLELLQGVPAYSYAEKSVWASNSRYYIDGKAYALDTKTFEKANTEELRHQLEKYSPGNSDTFFQENITAFLTANQQRLKYIVNEAIDFVQQTAKNFSEEQIVLSFSGGKDSTATADIVSKAYKSSQAMVFSKFSRIRVILCQRHNNSSLKIK